MNNQEEKKCKCLECPLHIELPHNHGSKTADFIASKPEPVIFEQTASTFQMISDSTRLKILWLLCHSEDCVVNIAAAIEMSSPAVSHHLRLLKQSGLIISRRVGKETYYTLADTEEAALVHDIVDRTFNIKCR
ncbi:ArsR/SmtB family transcription factor [Aminipila terrae]|uniref:Metalloregulator ArsR/SmtB family transcription factor n=1 Tax=Aminipila terrae TaxID=2697030 RepID=A0A6P1MEY8_9FIRM|nr:metalloregulator ArsR/SmtB family transcription factor [Aminipila terrae]QHI72381.1 metalloregulator ArsR/SmtB family transcription factor [Aminipila terrae]